MKIKLRKSLFFILGITVFGLTVKAQTTPSLPAAGVEITKAIPASPDAAALGKYGTIPVGPYTGVPNISIPLYTITSGDLTLPVSLSYHSSGNKVEDMASSVGLGWSLNAGGVITRTIRGKADEENNGFLTQASAGTIYYLKSLSSLTAAQQSTLDYMLNGTADGTLDSEPDVYSYNFGGYSGKFIMDAQGGVHTIPLQNIKFSFYTMVNSSPYIDSFTAQTPDGNKYYFGTAGATEYTVGQDHGYHRMSWFLYKVTSPSGHEIDLNYTTEQSGVQQAPTQTIFLPLGPVTALQPDNLIYLSSVTPQNGTSIDMHNVKLSSISFENGSLIVTANSNRLDINSFNAQYGAKAVDMITISSSGFSKTYNFYYNNQSTTRLRLDSLIANQIGGSTTNQKQKYRFDYNSDTWNGGNYVFNQDYWGYCNGQGNVINNQGILVPTFSALVLNRALVTQQGANRSSSEGPMQTGMLTKITYPTGGYTVFNYEANREWNINIPSIPNPGDQTSYETAITNTTNTGDLYYHFDVNNGNPNDMMYIYSPSTAPVAVRFTASGLTGTPNELNNVISAYAVQYDAQGDSVNYYNIANTAGSVIYLPAATYRLKVKNPKNGNQYTYLVDAQWSSLTPAQVQAMTNNYLVGGLRIRSIADYDGMHTTPFNQKTYEYLQPGTTFSSGYLDFQPVYNYLFEVETPLPSGTASINTVFAYQANTSFSNYPLATTQGSVVGYGHVTEYLGTNGANGKNEYFYTTSASNPDLSPGGMFPFAPNIDQEWHRGLLLHEINWKLSSPNNFVKAKENINNYSTINNYTFTSAYKAGFNPKPANYSITNSYTTPSNVEFGHLLVTAYNDLSDFTYLSSDTARVFDDKNANNYVQTWHNYQYDPATYQLNLIRSANSKNELITQTVKYPNSYYSNGPAWMQNLLGSGILSYPIEEITQKSNLDGTNSRTVKAIFTQYKATVPFRDLVFETRNAGPITNFTASSASGGTIVMDSHYQSVVSFDKYDKYGNILQEKQVGGPVHSYIWGYPNTQAQNNTYPVAEVINADSANIAYTNFESYAANGSGNWTYAPAGTTTDVTAPMGSSCYLVSAGNTLSKTGLSAATSYILSFWSKTGAAITPTGGTVTNTFNGIAKSGWTYHEYLVTGTTTVTVGGSGYIDELRLYPSNAQMSTYTYIPLVGMASKCDVKNDISYYSYDNIGRLTQVQDQNHSILKDYQYNYANYDYNAQVQMPQWVDIGVKRCAVNNTGNTGEEQMEQRDQNAYSITYYQTRWRSLGTVTTDCPLPPPPIYLTLKFVNNYTSGGDTYSNYQVFAYSDAAGKIPVTVTNAFPISYSVATTTTTNGTYTGTTITNYNATIPAGALYVNLPAVDITTCGANAGPGVSCTSVVTGNNGANFTYTNGNEY